MSVAAWLTAIAALSLYLLIATAVGGPGGNKEAFEEGRQNVVEAVQMENKK